MGKYYIIITDAGVALEAAAHAAGEPVVLTAFGVCDGGTAFTPDPALTALADEAYRGDISSLLVSTDDASVLEAQCIIPASSGGYTIRGIGLYAGDTLYAVGNYPDQPKPAPDSGYAASLEILAQLAVSDTADVTLNVSDGAWLTREEGDQLYVPVKRKVNGHALSADANVTAQDIFSGQAVAIGEAADLNSLTTPGLYYQAANAQAKAGKNYPEANAGSLEIYKHAGITQVYRVYNNSRTYIRSLYDKTWSAWTKQYDAANKPTAADVGAIPLAGSTGVTGIVRSSAELQSSSADSFRIGYGGYGTLWRNDGANLYLMLTDKDDPWGGYNDLRPFRVNLSNGEVIISKLNLSDFGYFDARYYTKTQSNAAYMPKTGAYTKTESDGRYQAKGSYTPAGTAYTKAESNAKYPTAFRVGSRVTYHGSDFGGKVPQGAVNINNYTNNDDRINGVVYAYLQFYLNGKWVNFS